jgi:hypothetical protein
MITRFMIEEIEGLMILLSRPADKKLISAIEQLPKKEIKAYRDSLAQEFGVLRPDVHLLLEED